MTVKSKKKVTKKKAAKVVKKFKSTGGSRFSLSLNDNKLHDIIREECNLFGSSKMSGTTSPFEFVDTYRAALFFMWGIPLNTPLDKDFKKRADKALKRLKKEDPEGYKEWKAKNDARKG